MADEFLRGMLLVLFGSRYAGITAQIILNIICKITGGEIDMREEISNRNAFGIILLIILGILLLPGVPIVIVTFLLGFIVLGLWNLLKSINRLGMKHTDELEGETINDTTM